MKMNRRHFLQSAGWAGVAGAAFVSPLFGETNGVAWAEDAVVRNAGLTPINTPYKNLLILIELKGANDGLNTVVPYADPAYNKLRPKLGLERANLIALSEREALHPSLQPMMALWENKELAIIQGLGYPSPNLSHFRSIEIWETASKSDEYLDAGWLHRTFTQTPPPRSFAADGVVVGSNDMGPLSGAGARTIALADTAQFLRVAKLAQAGRDERNHALKHILAVESEIVHAASKLNTNYAFKTEFPKNAFAGQIRTAAQLVA
ncbi:MAG: Twin-arginine translocation pathway signal sequence domain-containing protein, partial [Pseudomonadota bacterium]